MTSFAIAVICALGLYATKPNSHASEKPQTVTATSPERISETLARSITSRLFPDSAFENAELEKEHGRWTWAVYLRPQGSNRVQQIRVEALTGDIIASETKTPSMTGDAARRVEDAQRQR
ncbi:MAG TPA: hypothetical protein VFN25_08385 [Dokdonella sp.]|uniref:PepSY domain-containing protein n=1 Tax=Dokdonella sp. TaxID=2291710 RepID=UPI002D80A0FF|nr:hypothetical protein [Dokdonella sp.]HET9032909.1 hypothetical protein [Dokdonella sp.]